MSTELVEELVLSKRQAQVQAQQMLSLVGALALQHGDSADSNGTGITEYRLTKAKITRIEGYGVQVRSLKTGGLVITVRKNKDT